MSIMHALDGYKTDHRRQYPNKTEFVYSNWTPRESRVEGINEVTFFGLQYFLKKYLGEEFDKFFQGDVNDICEKYTRRMNGYLGPDNRIGSDHIRALHNLGYLPLEFRALPEGTSVPLRVPMFTVENTHPDFAWLVNYFETLLSATIWMPCTSATKARHFRKILETSAAKTGGDPEFIDWQGHDFSFRGMPGVEAAALSGAGHLIFFNGTDTIPAIDLVEEYYGGEGVGGSVAATEHSVMCAGGAETELETFERLLELYPTGILSVVSDTWDLWHVLTDILPALHDKIMARDGKLVIRPDSGDPVKIICGDPDAAPGSPAFKGVIELLYDEFGGTTNAARFVELDSHVGAIYGDSINFERAQLIGEGLKAKRFASTNVVYGVGSFTYQFATRDTFGFAMKATHVTIDGVGMDIFKDPVTDTGMKKSARGRLAVIEDPFTGLQLVDQLESDHPFDELKLVWRDGAFLKMQSFDEIRKVARG